MPERLKSVLTSIGEAISGIAAELAKLPGFLLNAVKGLGSAIGSAIGSAATNLMNDLSPRRPSRAPANDSPDDSSSKHSAYVPRHAGAPAVQLSGSINMDGRKVGTLVASSLSDRMGRPGAAASPVVGMIPVSPGMAFA